MKQRARAYNSNTFFGATLDVYERQFLNARCTVSIFPISRKYSVVRRPPRVFCIGIRARYTITTRNKTCGMRTKNTSGCRVSHVIFILFDSKRNERNVFMDSFSFFSSIRLTFCSLRGCKYHEYTHISISPMEITNGC